MEKRFNLVNRRFGRLFILWRVKSDSPHTLWECKCDCGKIVKVTGRSLRAGTTKSCGCLKKDMVYLMREMSKHGYLSQSAMGAH
jgi:hypothetical protein